LLSLVGYYWLSGSTRALGAPDLGTVSDTIVLVTVQSIHTVDNSIDVKVLVVPDDTLMDQRLQVLNTDISVRFYPSNTVGDLKYPKGQSPAEVTTTLVARGDPDTWPFDSYSTDALGADLLVGSGDTREYVPARVEVAGALDGWDTSSVHSGESTQSSGRGDYATLTLRRALGPLAFDLGICLVLITLPALALFVAIEMIRGKKKFLPPFSTWYAAMLFAVVPLRNILPGAPPPGAWIDQAVVLWVLIALAAAMVIYVIAWHRHSE
jgi:hypothetical protein